MTKVHIVNHTHWDREWYFTTSDALVLSDNSFTEVLEELERNPDARFCLDGQASIIEEYAEIRPERVAQIRQFVREGRLSIGPWFTQTDAFFVNGESIIRNLTLGIRDCKSYGGYMNIGYLPDTFGFNAQMPTILDNCGIDSMISFRGIDFRNQVTSPYFVWKGLSGREVIAINLVKGYGAAAFLEDSDTYINNKLRPLTELIQSKCRLSELLIPVGEDQLDIIPDLSEKLASISHKTVDVYEVSTYENFVEYLKGQHELEIYQGEFREPCLSRVHKSIGSIRYDIKRKNFMLEQKMLNRIEPLMAIARANHVFISERLLHKAWKKMMETHAHDGMGGCVSDNVAVDIFHRMKEADEIADGIENIITRRISEKTGLKENELLVFNTQPCAFCGYKKVQVVASSKNIRLTGCDGTMILDTVYFPAREHVRIVSAGGERYITEPSYYKITLLCRMELPPMGYRVITFEEKPEHHPEEFVKTADRFIANEYYTIGFDSGGLTVTTAFGKRLNHFLTFEDCGNDGDTYDFSPLEGDRALSLFLDTCEVRKTDIAEEMIVSGHFLLPKNLEDRLNEGGNQGMLGIELRMALVKGMDRIEVTCRVANHIYSHRLRVKINTDILAKETIASLPFGYIRRPVLKSLPENWEENYVEMPVDIEPFDSSVTVEQDAYHVTAFSKGMKEYQFTDESLYLTLFSSTGQLGKENLISRPGRASGDTTRQGHVMIETPMAELIGDLLFEFALQIREGRFDEYETAKSWNDYTVEHISYQAQTLNKFIYRLDNKIQPREQEERAPSVFSLLELEDTILFSSISPSLYSDGVLLRLKNPTKSPVTLKKQDFTRFKRVEKVNCIEEVCQDQELVIPAYDMLTLKLNY